MLYKKGSIIYFEWVWKANPLMMSSRAPNLGKIKFIESGALLFLSLPLFGKCKLSVYYGKDRLILYIYHRKHNNIHP